MFCEIYEIFGSKMIFANVETGTIDGAIDAANMPPYYQRIWIFRESIIMFINDFLKPIFRPQVGIVATGKFTMKLSSESHRASIKMTLIRARNQVNG